MAAQSLGRRQLLAAGSCGVAAALPGCGGRLGAFGGSSADAFPELPSAGARPSYRQWLPADWTTAIVVDLERLAAVGARLRPETVEAVAARVTGRDYFGVPIEDRSVGVWPMGTLRAHPGDFEHERVRAALETAGYSRIDGAAGTAYGRPGRTDSLGRVVVHSDHGVAQDVVDRDEGRQAALDRLAGFTRAAEGTRTRLHEASAAFERYSEAIGSPLAATTLLPGSWLFEGGDELATVTDAGTAIYVDGDRRVDRLWARFDDETEPDPAAVTRALRRGTVRGITGAVEGDPAVRTDGHVVDAAVTAHLDRSGGALELPPEFAVVASREDGGVILEHRGGDRIDLEDVRVVVGDGGGRSPFGTGPLRPGERASHEVADPSASLRVVYTYPRGRVTEVVASFHPDE